MFRFILFFILGVLSYPICAQNGKPSFSILGGYEINYFGKNGLIHPRFEHKNNILEFGTNYNFSDGFSNNPVLGIGIYYGYKLAEKNKWSAELGIEYRRQKPLRIVNIQTICYTSSMVYSINENWRAISRIGYGVATERSASAGSFDQFNNITGSVSILCAYIF